MNPRKKIKNGCQKFKMAAKKNQNDFLRVKKCYIKNKDPFVSTALWADKYSAKKNSKWPPEKFKMAAKLFKSDF